VDFYRVAEEEWKKKDTWGVGIPSGEGHGRVGFIKTHGVVELATGELWQAFVNATAHEIGHMGNRGRHSERGMMGTPCP
jgi:hypothetical protein